MPDAKITALTAISVIDPAVDPLPIVDVSDTAMAASGTTKKITINQLLGASGTATLASATITGDLTVDTSTLKVDSTNNRVGIGTSSPLAYALDVLSSGATTVAVRSSGAVGLYRGYAIADGTTEYGQFKQSFSTGELQIVSGTAGWGGFLTLSTGGSERYRIASDGVATWSNVGGVAGTAMTLNSTGLGVGVTPNRKLHIGGTGNQVLRVETITSGDPSINLLASGVNDAVIAYDRTNNYLRFDVSAATGAFIIGPTGNVGVGVTPSTVWTANGNLQVGVHAALYTNASLGATDFAYNSIRTGSDTYQYSFATSLAASRLQQRDGSFRFFTAPAGTSPNAITFTERLRLKETGQLRFVPLAADPAGAEAGDVYYNSSSNKLKCYNGTTWNDLF
jgi:hypothetical protein